MLEIGRIAKPHGIRGEVVVELITDRVERLSPGAVLSTDRGPLTVRRSQPHQHRWTVLFEGMSSREDAESLRGLILSAEPIEDPDVLWVHELIGCSVTDQEGIDRGQVVAVVANPASDLLELSTGALVPLRFVQRVVDGVITVDVPEGLFDE